VNIPYIACSQPEVLEIYNLYHLSVCFKVRNAKCNNSSKKGDIELFPGFKPALEATYIDWTDYCIEGITYSEVSYTVYQKASVVPGQTCLTSDSCCAASKVSPITNYKVRRCWLAKEYLV